MMPVKKELNEPSGEILYNSLILIVSIFLNLGAGLLVNKIGTSARESKIETRINGSYSSGLLTLSSNIPIANPK